VAISPGGRVADASPIGKPGGRRNWVDNTGGLPRYMRMIAHALIRKGMTPSRAIATAHEHLERLAATSKNPNVKAAAVAALAEWEAKRRASKAQTAAKRAADLSAPAAAADLDLADTPGLESDSTMVAVMLDGIDVPGLAQDDPHITLAYLGGTSPEQAQVVAALLRRRLRHGASPLYGTLAGLGEFPDNGDGVPYYVPADVPGLEELRALVVQVIERVPGVTVNRQHGFTPHMTLRYGGARPAPVKPVKISVTSVSVVRGGQRADITLGGDPMTDLSTTPKDVAELGELVDLSTAATDDGSVDLAPGDYRPPYDWKHGYIPLTPAAMRSKRKQGPKTGRAKPPKGVNIAGRGKVKPSGAATARLAKARDDEARGRAVPGEQKSAQNAVNASAPRRMGDRGLSERAQLELDYMRALRSGDHKRAGEIYPKLRATGWEPPQGIPSGTPRPSRKDRGATRAEVQAAKPEGKDARTMTDAEKISAVERMHGTGSPQHLAAVRRWGAQEQGRAAQRRAMTGRDDGAAGRAMPKTPAKTGGSSGGSDIARRINERTQARVAAGDLGTSGASSTSRSKGYRDLDGPRLVDEAAKRGLGGKEMLSRKSDSQLRTMLKDHDRNPTASHEDNARARSSHGLPAGITREKMLDRAERGGQNRADAARVLDKTLTEAGAGTIGPRLKHEGFVTDREAGKITEHHERVTASARKGADKPGVQGATRLDAATVSRMSDEQLDRAFERLSQAGDSKALALIGDEIDKRDQRRAEGNGRRR